MPTRRPSTAPTRAASGAPRFWAAWSPTGSLGPTAACCSGGIIIALGHVALAFKALTFFYLGLGLIVVGTGLLKPNISIIVGALYREGDSRRDAGFSVFYMGINLGAFLGPLIAGYLAQRVDWHLGFGCAAVGMAFGVGQYVMGKRHLAPAIERLSARPARTSPTGTHRNRPRRLRPPNGLASAPSSSSSSSPRSSGARMNRPPRR